jgi:hypothetical protein
MRTYRLLILMLLLPSFAFASNKFKFNELQIKDYDEMLNQVNRYLEEAKQVAIDNQEAGDDEAGDQQAIEKLSTAMTFILSRPDKDNMLAKLLPLVRKELMNYNSFESSLSLIATDAITALQMNKLPVSYRSTSVFVLENIMAQIQPSISTNTELRQIVEKVRDAKLKINDDISKHRKLTGMFTTPNPSELAIKVLAKYPYKAPPPEAKPKTPEKTPEDEDEIED